jgi:hypothetical protein
VIFVDSPRSVGDGRKVVRVWTDGDHADLHAICKSAGVSRECYRPPALTGATISAGGYYVVTSAKQMEALLHMGAVQLGLLPEEIALSHLICIGQAAARGQRQGELFPRQSRPVQPRPPGLAKRWCADTQREVQAVQSRTEAFQRHPEMTTPRSKRHRGRR